MATVIGQYLKTTSYLFKDIFHTLAGVYNDFTLRGEGGDLRAVSGSNLIAPYGHIAYYDRTAYSRGFYQRMLVMDSVTGVNNLGSGQAVYLNNVYQYRQTGDPWTTMRSKVLIPKDTKILAIEIAMKRPPDTSTSVWFAVNIFTDPTAYAEALKKGFYGIMIDRVLVPKGGSTTVQNTLCTVTGLGTTAKPETACIGTFYYNLRMYGLTIEDAGDNIGLAAFDMADSDASGSDFSWNATGTEAPFGFHYNPADTSAIEQRIADVERDVIDCQQAEQQLASDVTVIGTTIEGIESDVGEVRTVADKALAAVGVTFAQFVSR